MNLEQLKSRYHYDPETGIWTNLTYPNRKVGTKHLGYIWVQIDGRKYSAHRLAWFYMTGAWPVNQIDHKDTDRSNNKWNNLREATRSQNGANRHPQRNTLTGIKGVRITIYGYQARIRYNGKLHCLGTYDTPEEAKEAYDRFAQTHFGEFAR